MVESRMEACERRRRRAYRREVEDVQALLMDAREQAGNLRRFAPLASPVRSWCQQLDALIGSMAEEIKEPKVAELKEAVDQELATQVVAARNGEGQG